MEDKFIYKLERELISKENANLAYQYLLKKKKVARYLFDDKSISEFDTQWGYWNDPQVPNTYTHYGDLLTETILEMVKPKVEALLNKKLIEQYSFLRVYKNGDQLKRHTDRLECEISVTINMGGDVEWPFYLERPSEDDKKGYNVEKIIMNPGDAVLYRGDEVEHWREKFRGENCAQVFFHYNEILENKPDQQKYDNRPFLGCPTWTKDKSKL